jgi:tRNA G18 (ribose-2'-O)-methylase SpoU
VARRIDIHDPADPRMDDFRDLTAADRRPDRPGGRGLVIAEGLVVVRRLLRSAYPLRAVLGVPGKLDALASELGSSDVPCYAVGSATFAAVVGFHLNRGVLATADRAAQPAVAELIAAARTLAVLEGVENQENLGALFRNAAAFGIGGVLLGPGCADPLYRRSVRVSMGHVLGVPFARVLDLAGTADELRAAGFTVAALTPAESATPVGELTPGRLATLLGSEGFGLSCEAIAAADLSVRIPIAPAVDSLNVATAAAIAFYELTAPDRTGR